MEIVIHNNERCKDVVDERWKDRQKDLKDPEFDYLGFNYVDPGPGQINWKVIIGGSSLGAGPAMSCARMSTWTRAFTVWNIGFWTGEMAPM